ncbi:hypothetical protein JG688_00001129 [Phytophthora aleatoria]|uniref:Ion transport domain-containing protein n=1 Tax=Phytophthora aleatoria TaxID=2496075 RepID=A0A8J5MDH6_9STRA|nr:hypothetical protein JG688_00001129 [Phytophthora aleatoria]
MSSELRHRSKSMHGTTTGLLLKKFQLDSQRSHAIAQARNTSTTRLQVETDGSTDVIQAIINAAPGCYPGDDGSSDIADRYNFFVHRKRFLFAPCSLGIFPESSRFRQALIWCITWKRFDQFILFLILANSTILAIADYSKVDDQGDLDSSQSTRNAIVNSADRIFTILFAVECMKKLVSALLKSIPELLTVVAFLCFLFFLSDIMYMLQDAGYGTVAAIYFVSFIIFGSFFMLNLTLAVIWDNFSEASFLEAEERKTQKKAKAIILALRAAQAASDRMSPSRVQILFDAIVNHWMFNVVQTILILLNTIILSLDQYPIDQKLNETVEKINFALTLAFFIEALLKYRRNDPFPAGVYTSTEHVFDGSFLLRLEIFSNVCFVQTRTKLLTTMISTLQEVGNFSVLFLLFLYIYALIGMQTFANQFRFDEYGFPIDQNHEAAYIPRANFDTLLWSVVTVFQDEQEEEVPHLHTQDKRGWSYFTQRNSVLRTYQKRLVFNNDIKVATLEFAIMILSVAQLQWSYRSPYWDYFLRYGLELAYTAIFPYPGLETFLPALRGDTFVSLSISVFLRTISWGQWLYYPYPIRQKEKVASFSGNLDAMFFSVVIKKFSFSTMESRVHAFLYRMELYKKKDVSAVMALQATFRYIKSYRHSLVWHQERGCTTFYRPLSDRLPNEVKKKLYASRFQTSLKQIMKYNMDGDPLNAFSKHVEVITAGLGATFADMLRLKKMYNRRARVLEQRKQQANRRASSVCMTSSGRPTIVLSGAVKRYLAPLETRRIDSASRPIDSAGGPTSNAVTVDSKTGLGGVSTAWSDEMQRKCEATMLVLKRMETNMKDIQRTRSR